MLGWGEPVRSAGLIPPRQAECRGRSTISELSRPQWMVSPSSDVQLSGMFVGSQPNRSVCNFEQPQAAEIYVSLPTSPVWGCGCAILPVELHISLCISSFTIIIKSSTRQLKENLTVIAILPYLPWRPWFPLAVHLSVCTLVLLPSFPLLTQGEILHTL